MGNARTLNVDPETFIPHRLQHVEPLIEHLPNKFTFSEPCAGDGQLCRHLEYFGGYAHGQVI